MKKDNKASSLNSIWCFLILLFLYASVYGCHSYDIPFKNTEHKMKLLSGKLIDAGGGGGCGSFPSASAFLITDLNYKADIFRNVDTLILHVMCADKEYFKIGESYVFGVYCERPKNFIELIVKKYENRNYPIYYSDMNYILALPK